MTAPMTVEEVSAGLDALWWPTFPWHRQQQLALSSHSDTIVICGGNQCLGGEQEIWDPVARDFRRVDSVREPWHVWAWDGQRYVVAEAGVPFTKPRGELWRVSLSSGTSFVASPEHLVLTPTGWRVVRDVPPGCALSPIPSSGAPVLSVLPGDAPHSSQRVGDSPDGCRLDSYCGGAQLPWEANTAPVGIPSPAYVQAHIACAFAEMDARVSRAGHSRPDRQSDRLSSGHRASPETAPEDGSESATPESSARRAEAASREALPLHVVSRRGPHRASKIGQGLPQIYPVVCPLVVTNVEVVREDVKWDFTVPGYHNYWCAGVVHHNSGKTRSAAGIVGRLARREGPIYERLRNPERPLKLWVAPLTLEKWRSNWETLLLSEVMTGLGVTYTQSPHPVISWRDQYGENQLWGKSQDQGFLAFESDVVDLVVLDEEPEDRRVYTSCQQRFATTNGCLVMAFTPLRGMDWTFSSLYEPTAKRENQRAERCWRQVTDPTRPGSGITLIQMGMADNPAATVGAKRIAQDPAIPDAEKRTRLYGEYGFVEGLMFPQFQDWRPYYIETLPTNRPYSWILTVDPNKRHGGLLTALDHEGNRFYVAEYYQVGRSDTQHARAYLDLLAQWHCPHADIFADPGGAGAQSILNLGEHGVFAAPVPKDAGSVKASIDLVHRASWKDPQHLHPTLNDEKGRRKRGAPHCYFLGSLWTSNWDGHQNESRLVWELQRYRQKPNSPPGTPIKEDDDVVDCLRYLELVRPFAPAEPDTEDDKLRESLDEISYKESKESRRILAKHAAPRRRIQTGPEYEVDLT